jgi:outer membrane protein OmpA-like peptidoglycan-associated protein
MRVLTILLTMSALALPAWAQQDAERSKDHPMFSRMPGYYIDEYDAQDFAAEELRTDPAKRVEGRYWKIAYRLKEDARKFGPLQIGRNYTDLIVRRSGKKILEELDPEGGVTVAQLPAGGKNIWLQVEVYGSGESYYLTVVEEAGMEQKVEFSAMELARIINERGSVALHNILFDTGRATIKPESATALAPVGELLKNDASLKLEIQGHTDNVGAPAANLKLSQDRAAAVKAYLVQTLGADASRLTTAGFGDTRPLGDNRTEEGRTQNRRVELVKR